ncbi:MAG: serine hydrolase [Marinomonas sp.]
MNSQEPKRRPKRRAPQNDRAVLKKVGLMAAFVIIAALLALLASVYAERLAGQNKYVVEADESASSEAAPSAAADTRAPKVQLLEASLTRIGKSLNSRLGIAMVDLQSGEAVHYNGEQLMPQQSVSKLWVALTALEQADQGLLDLAERGTVRRGDLTLFHQPIRKKVLANGSFTSTYADFMNRALVGSDNTANNTLLEKVGGPEAVRRVLEAKGLGAIRFGPGERIMQSQLAGLEWDQSYSLGKTFFEVRKSVPHAKRRQIFDDYVSNPVDGATTLAMAQALAKLAYGELLTEASTNTLLGLMRDAKSGPNRLKGGLPEGWQIAHKTGTGQVLDIVPPGVMGEQTGYNDVGILTAPNGARYVVAVMIGNTKAPVPQRMDMMHAVVAAIAEYHGS